MATGSSIYQCYATFCVNLLPICYGALFGWSSSSFLLFQSSESPLTSGPLTTAEMSWIGSILCIGGLLGNVVFGWMADQFGRRISMLISVLPMLISWLIAAFARNVLYLCVSRFLGGVAGGAIFILVPLYVTEISEDRIRGSLGSCLVLSTNVGTLIAFILGNYTPYNMSPYIFIFLSLIYLILCMFLPESPIYLMKSRKEREAERSLRFFRNLRKMSPPPEHFKTEMEKLRCEFMDGKKVGEDLPLSWNDFNNPLAKRVMLIGCALMALNQFCGCFAMINYTATLFEESGSTLSPNASSIIVGVIQMVGAYISTLLVERAGRKLLMMISAFGTGIGHIFLGLYSYLKMVGYNIETYNWIPIASFSFAIFIGSWGVLTLPFLVLSEITPPKIRSFASSFCMTLLWLFAFLIVKYLPILTGVLELHGCMFIFATCCFAGAIFILIYVPETKGKSLESILAMIEEKATKK